MEDLLNVNGVTVTQLKEFVKGLEDSEEKIKVWDDDIYPRFISKVDINDDGSVSITLS